MGAILAKFRKEKSTVEVLEGLEEKITQIEKYTINTQEQKRRIVGNFLAISIGIYVIAFIIFYFVYFPPTWRERFVYFVPLLLFPFVIILLRRLFTWYFERKLNKNSVKLTALHAEKKKILEQVMDKETYKVAVKLLARYGDKSNLQKSLYAMTPRAPAPGALNQTSQRIGVALSPSAPATTNLISDLRMRPTMSTHTAPIPRPLGGIPSSPAAAGAASTAVGQTLYSRQPLPITPHRRPMVGAGVGVAASQELRRRTPFPIVNQQGKGVLERIVDVLIGDGPQDRFAMICKECYAHNGMALKEDFDYTTFRCAFCNALNTARKVRPISPRLPEQQFSNFKSSSSSSSETDSENEEVGGTITTLSALATPHIVVTEATNATTVTTKSADASNTFITMQSQQDMGAGDGPVVLADAAEVDQEQEEMNGMDIDKDEKEETSAISQKVVLQALHDTETEELSRLQECFAKMYTKAEVEKLVDQLRADGEEEPLLMEQEHAENMNELKKLK